MNEDFSLSKDELLLLTSMVGTKISTLSSSNPPDDDEFWWPLTLVGENRSIAISNEITTANYFAGSEDCGRLSISSATLPADTIYAKNINQRVTDIKVVTNVITFPEQAGCTAYSFIYPRALIFEFAHNALVIERGWRFQEYLIVSLQMLDDINLADELLEWYDPDEDAIKPQLTQKINSVTTIL